MIHGLKIKDLNWSLERLPLVIEGDGSQGKVVLKNAPILFVDDTALDWVKSGGDAVFSQKYRQLYELPVNFFDCLSGELLKGVL